MTHSQLKQHVAGLEAENEALRRASGLPQDASVASAAIAVPQRGRGIGWTIAATVLIVIGALLSPLAVAGHWAKLQLSDTATFVDTFAPLADDPAVQSFVTVEVMTAIDERIDIDGLTEDVFSSLAGLGLPPRAAEALEAFQGVAANGIRSLMTNAIGAFVRSDAFDAIWQQSLTTSHQQIVKTLNGDTDAALAISDEGEIGVQLGPIVERVKEVLLAQGIDFAANIPDIDRTVVVAQSDSVVQAQVAYQAAVTFGAWMPWIALAFFVAGVAIARRRSIALIWAAIALAISMGLVLIGVSVGEALFVASISPTYVPGSVARTLYENALSLASSGAVAIGVLALTIALIGWLAGPFAIPTAGRRLVVGAAASVRRRLADRGLSMGRMGRMLFRLRHACRVVLGAIGVAIVLFTRPITPSLIFTTAAWIAVALLVLEVLQLPDDEVEQVPDDEETARLPDDEVETVSTSADDTPAAVRSAAWTNR